MYTSRPRQQFLALYLQEQTLVNLIIHRYILNDVVKVTAATAKGSTLAGKHNGVASKFDVVRLTLR